jgi:hypothetical protein
VSITSRSFANRQSRPAILECSRLFTLLAPIFEGSFEGPPLLRRKHARESVFLCSIWRPLFYPEQSEELRRALFPRLVKWQSSDWRFSMFFAHAQNCHPERVPIRAARE